MELIKCLICGQLKCGAGGGEAEEQRLKDNLNEEISCSLISKHLQVIFLLRNILEVPSSKLGIFLKSHPKLESWLSVCDKCTLMVHHCKSTYQLILEAQSKFQTVKQEIIQLLKESALIKQEISQCQDDDGYPEEDNQVDIVEDIRGFVYQNEYPENIDPFISGDLQAYQQLSHNGVDKALDQLEDVADHHDNQSWTSNDDKPTNHLSISSKSIPCPVSTCPRKFSNDQVLTRHIRKFHGDKNSAKFEISRTTCKICGKKFGKIHLLKKHIRSVHNHQDNLFNCDLCGVGKGSNLQLSNHRKNCKGQSLSCPMAPRGCDMKCSNYTTLNYHVRLTHKDNIDDLLPFKCLECGVDNVAFLSAEQLKRHMSKKHGGLGREDRKDKGGGEYGFVCETCGGSFGSKYGLTNHRNKSGKCKGLRGLGVEMGKGEEVKPWICEICGGVFKSKEGLQMHGKVVHERRFVRRCEICGKGMSWKGRLEKHLWMEHGVGDGGGGGKWGMTGVGVDGKRDEKIEENKI